MLLEAVSMAQDVDGLSWRRRAESDLAKLSCSRTRSRDAPDLLRPSYAAFTEDFATHDLVAAAELIAASSASMSE